ncbi:short-chain dehydrogenase/reductase [Xylaria venustula]|nr:short-chain dehydrogenase/reductase [Xylaria venustula]
MVDIQTMIRSNGQLSSVERPSVALFVGATSGIGLGVLKEYTRLAVSPRIYIVARNPGAAAPIVDELRLLNPKGSFEIIDKNVSLIKDAEKVAGYVKAKESSLDLLFMSPGFVSLDGRQDTSEGFDASMTTRYYSRAIIAQHLIPLLNEAQNPRVVSILAGGKEGPVDADDLALNKPGKFSLASASYHSATMNTLTLERFASENPRISFVHAFPGLVNTPLLGRMKSGVLGALLRYTAVPVVRLLSRSVSDAGHWGLFLATSARYSVDHGVVPLTEGVQKATRTPGGIFLVDEKGETADNEKLLGPLRQQGLEKRVRAHTEEVFGGIR